MLFQFKAITPCLDSTTVICRGRIYSQNPRTVSINTFPWGKEYKLYPRNKSEDFALGDIYSWR